MDDESLPLPQVMTSSAASLGKGTALQASSSTCFPSLVTPCLLQVSLSVKGRTQVKPISCMAVRRNMSPWVWITETQ